MLRLRNDSFRCSAASRGVSTLTASQAKIHTSGPDFFTSSRRVFKSAVRAKALYFENIYKRTKENKTLRGTAATVSMSFIFNFNLSFTAKGRSQTLQRGRHSGDDTSGTTE